ncbi:MAG: dihydrodipicolinate synthase family protein [Bryobacteraceae bacterium]|nr:dihydrodipicolinate synthase family protein [Bryobacteraceae bacterium]
MIQRRHFLALAASQAIAQEKVWEGIFVIMQTPFLDNLEIDVDSLRRESDFLCRGRVHGVVWPAGAGESVSISYQERMRHSESVVKEVKGRVTVLVGVHGVNKFEAMEYARHAEKIGADGLHALGPTSGASDPEILSDYFQSIASVSRLPMCIQVSNAGMSTDFLLRMADRIPTLRILKLEAGDVPHDVTRVLKQRKRPIIPSTGGGAMNLMNEMERGSGGTMAGAGFADIQAEIWDLFHAGRKQEAHQLFLKFLPSAVLERRTTYVLQKEILRRRGIFRTVVMRNTRRFTMDEADLRELDRIMESLKPHFRVS